VREKLGSVSNSAALARCEVVVGLVMRVPAEATDAERESLRQQLEADLRAIP